MKMSWTQLPVDVKILIVKPLDRISKINLRQCSREDKLLVDALPVPIKEINFVACRSYITITFDDGLSDFFEKHEGGTTVRRQENLIPFARFRVEDDFQRVAWRSFRNMLRSQHDTIDSLIFTFIGSLQFNGEVDEPGRIVPELPSEAVRVCQLSIFGDSNEAIDCQILKFVKPQIENLVLGGRVVDLTRISELGTLEQVKNARSLFSSAQMTVEQTLELKATTIDNRSTQFTDLDICTLLMKSIEKGTPTVFNYYRMWPDYAKIVSKFESTQWNSSFSEIYSNPPVIDLTKKNFILTVPAESREIFVAFDRFDVSGFILNRR